MIDYKKIGFKAGLEIHQQLDTGKLFCNCPGILRNDEPKFRVKRKLHQVAGEGGVVDIAAKFQHSLDKEFIYEGYDTTCLVELDEEPPHEINKEALHVAIEIALLLNCKIIPISQIMRKIVVDGSNTSGFQRTVMIARDGYIETSEGKVEIDSVYLEEDSARKISSDEKKAIYRLDRLGIPLVEISTRPDLKSAKEVKEAALIIGDILRSSKVKRGIGTIRQDLNISIKGSNRVEIKGFQDPKIMEKTVDTEIERQKFYLEIKDKLPPFKRSKLVDVTEIFSPKLDWMKKEIKEGKKFIALKVENYSGLLGKKENSKFWLGREVANLAKTKGFGGIIHSDEDLEKYQFEEDEIKKLKTKLKIKDKDLWMMLLGDETKIISVMNELIFPFLHELKNGNPKEVRNCLPDGTTEFLRPMPGSSRMYPETDLELLHIHRDLINEVKKTLPKLNSEIEEELKKHALREEQIKILLKDKELFKLYSDLFNIYDSGILIANMIIDYPKYFSARMKLDIEKIYKILNEDVMSSILEKVNRKELNPEEVRNVFEKILNGTSIVEALKTEKEEINFEEKILKIIKDKPGLTTNAYMGLVMKEFKGKISGKDATEIIEKLMKE